MKTSGKPRRWTRILVICLVVLLLVLFLPPLLSGTRTCVYDDALLGASREEIEAGWTRVRVSGEDTIAIETVVYQVWQRGDERMVAVFEEGRVCDYLVCDQRTGALRGSLTGPYRALPILLGLRFGIRPDAHYYDVGSGGYIDSWLTCDGKVIVWFDSAEVMVHDAFTLKNAPEYMPMLVFNVLVHLPYTLAMMLWYRVLR